MADEPNIPSHRWYQDRYHINLPMEDVSESVIKAAGVRKIDQAIVSPIFAASEQGVWFDPSDISTLFQDSAGTTPVTAAGQPVGLMMDKSGRGNHATQSGDSRPTYGINPITGRRNLLTYTELFNNAAWVKTSSTVTSGQTDPLGGSTAFTLTATAADGAINQSYTQLAATDYTFSIWVRRVSGTGNVQIRTSQDPLSFGAISVTNEWQRFSRTTTSNLAGAVNVAMRVRTSGDVVQIWGAQLELGTTATAYQRVTTQYDVTEAGVQSAPYLQFDGVDDSMVTDTITPAIDKVQMFAGIRMLSSSTNSILAEFSASLSANAGSFNLQAPLNTDNYRFASRGSLTGSTPSTGATFTAPVTNVVSGTSDISGDLSILRVNGTQQATSAVDQGTGNYLAYPLYIGRRGGTSNPYNGRLYGLIIRFGANLTAEQVTTNENWVNAKTGAF